MYRFAVLELDSAARTVRSFSMISGVIESSGVVSRY